MREYRFLLSRRWVIFALVVVLLTYATWWLGEWQWHRLSGRKDANSLIETNEKLPAAPPAQVLGAPGQTLDDANAWRVVSTTGFYDVAHTVIVRYRDDAHGQSGVDVVVPLTTTTGASVLVDRGFLATDATPSSPADVPAPPPGQVTVTGYARVDGSGSSTAVNADQSVRAISSTAISAALGVRLYGGFVQATTESPGPATALAANELPDLGNGPHFFYALQWWFFGLLAVFGFGYLAYDEKVRGPRGGRDTRGPVDRAPAGPGGPSPTPAKVRKVRQTNVPAAYQRPRKSSTSA